MAHEPTSLARRSFLALASAAVGAAWLRPAWTLGAERLGPSLARDHGLALRVPRRTINGSKVPIVVEVAEPMTPGHHVTRVRVTNESDPIATKGVFDFTPANGRVYLAFQARTHEGASEFTATATCNRHGDFSARSPIEIPPGAGGCSGVPPAFERTSGDDIRAPVIRIPALVDRGVIRRGEFFLVQVKMRHPNRTGLTFRNGRFVQESEPIHLDSLEVFYGGAPVSHFALTSALSDDPFFTFGLLARRTGTIRVVATNSRGQQLDAEHELRVA